MQQQSTQATAGVEAGVEAEVEIIDMTASPESLPKASPKDLPPPLVSPQAIFDMYSKTSQTMASAPPPSNTWILEKYREGLMAMQDTRHYWLGFVMESLIKQDMSKDEFFKNVESTFCKGRDSLEDERYIVDYFYDERKSSKRPRTDDGQISVKKQKPEQPEQDSDTQEHKCHADSERNGD